MAEWPESHVIVILEAEARDISIPRGTVALRDPEDGMYIATGLDNGRLWLDRQVDRIASWIDVDLEHIGAVQHGDTPNKAQVTDKDVREKFRTMVLCREANTMRHEEWWPANELNKVNWDDRDSVSQAVLSAYYESSYFSGDLLREAVASEPATIEQVNAAGRKAISTDGSTDAVDDYAVALTSYWIHKFATR